MGKAEFYLYHEGQQVGPWTLDEVLGKLKNQELSWADYVYSDAYKEWVSLMEAPHFSLHYQEIESYLNEIRERNTQATESKSYEDLWFVLKGQERFGPYSPQEILGLVGSQKLSPQDFVWNNAMEGWKPLGQVPQLSPDNLKGVLGAVLDPKQLLRRRHTRVKYGASILIHNHKEVWKGRSMEISSGGASIILDHDKLTADTECFLHFKAGEGVPSFNCNCKIVHCKPLGGGQYLYGVQFTNISPTVQRAIKGYTVKSAA